jgi:hypothetical protein
MAASASLGKHHLPRGAASGTGTPATPHSHPNHQGYESRRGAHPLGRSLAGSSGSGPAAATAMAPPSRANPVAAASAANASRAERRRPVGGQFVGKLGGQFLRITEPILTAGLTRDVVAQLEDDPVVLTTDNAAGPQLSGQGLEPAHPRTAATARANWVQSRRRARRA